MRNVIQLLENEKTVLVANRQDLENEYNDLANRIDEIQAKIGSIELALNVLNETYSLENKEDTVIPTNKVVSTKEFPSSTRMGLVHTVTQYDDASITCSCEGFTHRQHCKHVDEFQNNSWSRPYGYKNLFPGPSFRGY